MQEASFELGQQV